MLTGFALRNCKCFGKCWTRVSLLAADNDDKVLPLAGVFGLNGAGKTVFAEALRECRDRILLQRRTRTPGAEFELRCRLFDIDYLCAVGGRGTRFHEAAGDGWRRLRRDSPGAGRILLWLRQHLLFADETDPAAHLGYLRDFVRNADILPNCERVTVDKGKFFGHARDISGTAHRFRLKPDLMRLAAAMRAAGRRGSALVVDGYGHGVHPVLLAAMTAEFVGRGDNNRAAQLLFTSLNLHADWSSGVRPDMLNVLRDFQVIPLESCRDAAEAARIGRAMMAAEFQCLDIDLYDPALDRQAAA